ncbi:metal-dependent hydrolase [Candidatus Woesearchaeota archaeon]|nr:metal-dependent hydrolase [Candidatus Woesearchaeota archaeon]
MPNAKTHFLVGAGVGAIAYCIIRKVQNQPIELPGLLGMGLAGGVAGLLPDIIEPATSPNHRGLAHSIAALAVIGSSIGKLHENQNLEAAQKELLITLAFGYGSHLLLDAGTPASLPII